MEWPLLRSLSDAERQDFLALGRRRRFARNEVVCHEGDPADALHLVLSGHLTIRVSLASGDVATINVLGPGSSFGELALLRADGTRTATVTALEPSETIAVPASAFHQLCRRQPEVQRMLSVILAERVDELSRRLLEMSYVGLDRRVHRRLAELAASYGDGTGPTTVPLTQVQLADLTGGTRPTINQILQRLVDQGIVEVGRGRIVVLDLPRLERKAGN
ncbi:Crp/Fnr family transcriptional regulator [Nocardioides sp. Root190]|uniref:Crp/Fnr family transcriptional regulator n=1 Tax=Nocardioides sp. Root190 TaxID=1736488 RepID=UPI0019105227|nr:Crp/Fnr family transcriptional regulator [Nocardioides sp. Root190]